MNPQDETEIKPVTDAEGLTDDVTLDAGPSDMIENEDGSTTIVLDEASAEAIDPEFYDNLAEDLIDDADLSAIAADLVEHIEADIEARKARDEAYADALRRTGLDGNPTSGADFEGASNVVVPLVTEACVDFAARAIKELFPLGGPEGGPAKMHIVGKATTDKVERGRRKSKFMNWQLTQQLPWFRQELEQALTQVPMAGASYIKFSWNRDRQRPDTLFIPLEDVVLPAAASSFATADRKTHRQTVTQAEFDRRTEAGMYREIADTVLGEPDSTESQDAIDAIEGVERSSENIDGTRIVYECACFLDLDADSRAEKKPAPYLVSIDEPTGKIIAIYRNWAEDDPDLEPLEHMVEFPFIPWRGAYPLNLPQMIGGLSTAATGALRALLDSAHASNMPGGLYLKGSSASKGGQNITLRPGEYHPVEGAVGVADDIRKMVMPAPVNPPSAVLYELLGFLITQGRGVVTTTMESLSDQNPNAPVGTTLALIEQGMTVFSAIHARLHAAMGRALVILARLNRVYLRDEMQVRELGELVVKRADFDGPADIIPVSDPNIFSETQRMAQVQMVAQRAAAMPQLYDLRKVELLILERSRIPEAESLLIPVPEPQRLNAVNENVAACMGKPLVAFPDQNHIAHLRMHIEFLTHPMFGQSQLLAPALIPQMLTHLKDHIVYWYVANLVEMGEAVTGVDMAKLMDEDEEVEREYENLLADLSSRVLAGSEAALGPFQIPQVVSQAIQIMQQLQQMAQGGPQSDPAVVAMADIERQGAADQAKMQADQAKMQIDAMRAEIEQSKLALKEKELALKEAELSARYGIEGQKVQQQGALKSEEMTRQDTRVAGQIAAQVKMNESDNAIALQIARERLALGRAPGVTNGTGINPVPR
jgi:hypothetical protein